MNKCYIHVCILTITLEQKGYGKKIEAKLNKNHGEIKEIDYCSKIFDLKGSKLPRGPSSFRRNSEVEQCNIVIAAHN